MAMQRTTIALPDELLARVRRIADEQGNSVAAVIRDALEEKVRDYRPRSLGIGVSGYSDTARKSGYERPVPR